MDNGQIREGKEKKGGVNVRPTTPPPGPPKGQGPLIPLGWTKKGGVNDGHCGPRPDYYPPGQIPPSQKASNASLPLSGSDYEWLEDLIIRNGVPAVLSTIAEMMREGTE